MARAQALKPIDPAAGTNRELELLRELEKKVLWLSTWTIHHANHIRPRADGLKVGGHQASSASVATVLTALYFSVLRPEDRVAVKPHASPAFHAIQYLLGLQSREKLERFRAWGGAQSYPSRTKDTDDVDFSTGSVGLGVAMTTFAALVQDYLHLRKGDAAPPPGRMVAIAGDAELDEGNIFEALLEGWKHDIRNVWWVIDYNRQSLDSVVSDRLFTRIDGLFTSMGWRVVTLKYGKMLEEAFSRPGGDALRRWIDDCPNTRYSALVFKGGPAWRAALERDIGDVEGIAELLRDYDDEQLHDLMTNLAGQDMEAVMEAFRAIDDDRPTCFIAYTIKGYRLPLEGHKDNHAGLMNPAQMEEFRAEMGVPEGEEWERFAGLKIEPDELQAFLDRVPFAQGRPRRLVSEVVPVPERLPAPRAERMSTQEGFGRILNEISRGNDVLADRIVTTSPDVTVSTNLGAWVNQRGIFNRQEVEDVFRAERVVSAQKWSLSPRGQHIELGIAENNLFLLLAALGLSGPLFGERVLPIGTLYDPFIGRGLDALTYALYQDARFVVVGTPAGVTLAPEGGAHQSIGTPLVGMGLPGLSYFEPAYVDELAVILGWSFRHMQSPDGGSVYLRLSTRQLEQPGRELDDATCNDILNGAYWVVPPEPGAELAIVYSGAVAPEATAAHRQILEDIPGAGLLAVTSPDRLHEDWLAADRSRAAGRHASAWIERVMAPLAKDAALVTVLDGHPATLSWIGSALGRPLSALGVERFGQSGEIQELYRDHRLDEDAILDAAATALLRR